MSRIKIKIVMIFCVLALISEAGVAITLLPDWVEKPEMAGGKASSYCVAEIQNQEERALVSALVGVAYKLKSSVDTPVRDMSMVNGQLKSIKTTRQSTNVDIGSNVHVKSVTSVTKTDRKISNMETASRISIYDKEGKRGRIYTLSSSMGAEQEFQINEDSLAWEEAKKILSENDQYRIFSEKVKIQGVAHLCTFAGIKVDFRQGKPALAQVSNVDIDLPEGTLKRENAIAIIIGNSDYQHLANVDFAVNDARSLKNYLVSVLGYRKKNVKVYENASFNEFRRIFGTVDQGYHDGKVYKAVSLAAKKQKNPEVFVYYSGHGAPSIKQEGRAYIVPTDASMNFLDQEAFPLSNFYSSIAALPSTKVTVVLDSCFSGNTEAGMLYEGISPAALKTDSEVNPKSLDNATVMTSAAPNQVSYWHEQGQHGLFTYYFLKGLRGNADSDADQSITMQELFDYIDYELASYVLDNNKPSEQTPQLTGKGVDDILVSF